MLPMLSIFLALDCSNGDDMRGLGDDTNVVCVALPSEDAAK